MMELWRGWGVVFGGMRTDDRDGITMAGVGKMSPEFSSINFGDISQNLRGWRADLRLVNYSERTILGPRFRDGLKDVYFVHLLCAPTERCPTDPTQKTYGALAKLK